jgi:hypothetical protein
MVRHGPPYPPTRSPLRAANLFLILRSVFLFTFASRVLAFVSPLARVRLRSSRWKLVRFFFCTRSRYVVCPLTAPSSHGPLSISLNCYVEPTLSLFFCLIRLRCCSWSLVFALVRCSISRFRLHGDLPSAPTFSILSVFSLAGLLLTIFSPVIALRLGVRHMLAFCARCGFLHGN